MRDLLSEANQKLSSETDSQKRVNVLEAKLRTLTLDTKTRETVSLSSHTDVEIGIEHYERKSD